MEDTPIAPPPPAPQEGQHATDVAHDDHHAVAQAEGEGMPPAVNQPGEPLPPPAEPPPAAEPAPEELNAADAAAVDAAVASGQSETQPLQQQDQPLQDQPTSAALPTIPDITEIPGAVKAACLADGIPEAEFARDFPLPVEVRERLFRATVKNLMGAGVVDRSIPAELLNKLNTVGDLIDYFEESHPDHPTQSGAGS